MLRIGARLFEGTRQFGKPIGAFQLTQKKLADMAIEIEKGTLLAYHLGRMKEDGRLRPEHVSIGKLNNAREAIKVRRTCRGIRAPTASRSSTDHAPHANLESCDHLRGHGGGSHIGDRWASRATAPCMKPATPDEVPLEGAVGAIQVASTVRNRPGRGRRRSKHCCGIYAMKGSIWRLNRSARNGHGREVSPAGGSPGNVVAA